MNRYDFGSAVKREFVPAVGQRWIFALTKEECDAKLLNMPPEKRAMMCKFFKVNREKGYVIVGEDKDAWLVHRNPKNPHPLSRVTTMKKKWLEQYKFVGYEEIV